MNSVFDFSADSVSALARVDAVRALDEDMGGAGDLTAGLIDPELRSHARVLARQAAVVCGLPWVEATVLRLDPQAELVWHLRDGQHFSANEHDAQAAHAEPLQDFYRSADGRRQRHLQELRALRLDGDEQAVGSDQALQTLSPAAGHPALGVRARLPIDRMLAFTAAQRLGQPAAGLVPRIGAA